MTRLTGTNIFNAVDMLYVCKERTVMDFRMTLCRTMDLPRLDNSSTERTITVKILS